LLASCRRIQGRHWIVFLRSAHCCVVTSPCLALLVGLGLTPIDQSTDHLYFCISIHGSAIYPTGLLFLDSQCTGSCLLSSGGGIADRPLINGYVLMAPPLWLRRTCARLLRSADPMPKSVCRWKKTTRGVSIPA
jgi:hypothetical protein